MSENKSITKSFLKMHWIVTIYQCMVILFFTKMSPYEATSFYITYDNGFISRGLIATILYNIIPHEHYVTIVDLLCKCLTILTILYFNIKYQYFISKFSNNTNILKQLIILLFAPVCSHFMMMTYAHRLDSFLLILFIAMIEILSIKKLNEYLKVSICTVLSVLSILIHQGSLFITIPCIALYIWQTKNIKSAILYGIPVAIAFYICQFGNKIDYEIIIADFMQKAQETDHWNIYRSGDLAGSVHMIKLEYKYSILQHYSIMPPDFGFTNIVYLVIALILTFPFLKIMHQQLTTKIFKNYELICLASVHVILNILTCDRIRWFGLALYTIMLTSLSIIQNKPEYTNPDQDTKSIVDDDSFIKTMQFIIVDFITLTLLFSTQIN